METTSEIPNTIELLEDNTARASYRTSAAQDNSVISIAHRDFILVLLDLCCKSRLAEKKTSHFSLHTAPVWCIRKHKTESRDPEPPAVLRFYTSPPARGGWPGSPRPRVLPPKWSACKSVYRLDSKLSKPMEKEHQPLRPGC